MRVIFSDQSLDGIQDHLGIFLAGPTPREQNVKSWRPDAVKHLEALGFQGSVFVPERSDWTCQFEYLDQVEWEYKAIQASRVVMFWVPREMKHMIGLTTNVEFGYWIAKHDRGFVYGRPKDAPKTKYLDWLYSKHQYVDRGPIHETLTETLDAAFARHG